MRTRNAGLRVAQTSERDFVARNEAIKIPMIIIRVAIAEKRDVSAPIYGNQNRPRLGDSGKTSTKSKRNIWEIFSLRIYVTRSKKI